jgi:hypothetical protein
MKKTKTKTQIHDGIVGVVVVLSIVLALTVNMAWLWLAAIVGVLLISTLFTGFCPVYFMLNKLMPGRE